MLARAYKKILEDNQRVMKEQRERIDELKRENARLAAELENMRKQKENQDVYVDLSPVETYIDEVERLSAQKFYDEFSKPRRKVPYMDSEELEKLLSDIE